MDSQPSFLDAMITRFWRLGLHRPCDMRDRVLAFNAGMRKFSPPSLIFFPQKRWKGFQISPWIHEVPFSMQH